MINRLIQRLSEHRFLFEELVKRDFKRKYKRTVLGMFWSILSPLMTLLIMKIVFSTFFGHQIEHYMTYLFCGTLVFSYFRESTCVGMGSLLGNAGIFTKINVPKYIFLLSCNVSALINFALTLVVFFVFCALDGITFHWKMFALVYPIACLLLFNLGFGLILSALYLFFRDIQYLYDLFTMLLMYLSAIFYSVSMFPAVYQKLFLLNPMYIYISYFRSIVVQNEFPGLLLHGLAAFYALVALFIGGFIYKKYNTAFLYYV